MYRGHRSVGHGGDQDSKRWNIFGHYRPVDSLSLPNSSVSLTCNHVFCNLCILKSMKTASNCPVCKVPYHRSSSNLKLFPCSTEALAMSGCVRRGDSYGCSGELSLKMSRMRQDTLIYYREEAKVVKALQNLRQHCTLGQGLETSTYPGEVIFSIALAILGLNLFALLIGSMQVK